MNLPSRLFVIATVVLIGCIGSLVTILPASAETLFEQLLEPAIKCRDVPDDFPQQTIHSLIAQKLAHPKKFFEMDTIEYFALEEPQPFFSLTVVAVFKVGQGPVFGFVTRDRIDMLNHWIKEHGNPTTYVDDSETSIRGAKDVFLCGLGNH
jgi:hypothetical protein